MRGDIQGRYMFKGVQFQFCRSFDMTVKQT